ncbi:hypothetical protein D3C84_697450 [compost metagenome]
MQVHGGQQARVIAEALEQLGVVVHHIAVVTFRFQAVFHRLADDVLGADRTLFGSGAQRVEAHHLLAFCHDIAFANENCLYGAAAQVLHGFAIAGDFDRAGRYHAGIQRRQPGPQ